MWRELAVHRSDRRRSCPAGRSRRRSFARADVSRSPGLPATSSFARTPDRPSSARRSPARRESFLTATEYVRFSTFEQPPATSRMVTSDNTGEKTRVFMGFISYHAGGLQRSEISGLIPVAFQRKPRRDGRASASSVQLQLQLVDRRVPYARGTLRPIRKSAPRTARYGTLATAPLRTETSTAKPAKDAVGSRLSVTVNTAAPGRGMTFGICVSGGFVQHSARLIRSIA